MSKIAYALLAGVFLLIVAIIIDNDLYTIVGVMLVLHADMLEEIERSKEDK
jgi:hypothetical protein